MPETSNLLSFNGLRKLDQSIDGPDVSTLVGGRGEYLKKVVNGQRKHGIVIRIEICNI